MIERAIIAGLRCNDSVRWIADNNSPGSAAHHWRLTSTQECAYFFYESERDQALRAATKSGAVTMLRKRGWTPALWSIGYTRGRDERGRVVYEIVGCRLIFPLTPLEQLAAVAGD